MKRFPSTDLVQHLRTLGATHVTVNCRFMDPSRCRTLLASLAEVRELELVTSGMWQGAEVRLYAISTAAVR
jgi:hypothetical protein